MKPEPIDYNNPLGISKREWTKVLGINLALLLLVYAIALICTLCGNDLFLLRYSNQHLNNLESFLDAHDLMWCVHIPVACVEETIICAYVRKKKPSIFVALAFLVLAYTECTIIYFTTKTVPGFLNILNGIVIILGFSIKDIVTEKRYKDIWKYLLRVGIALLVSFALNEAISIFRTKTYEVFKNDVSSSVSFALNIEYNIALALSLGILTILIPWEKGDEKLWTIHRAGGSSPTSMKKSPKPTPNNDLNPKLRKRLFFLKAKVFVIQTLALAIIAFVPIVSGRGIEFSLVYVSFCVTRMILGFKHSLHFKSEMACVTIGALTFWGITYLAPTAEASIVISLLYGSGLALGFRIYWELHDLMMYRRASKTDRYAMLYTAFKGNLDPRRIRGVMRMKGITNEDEIKAIQMYMAREKVDYISQWMSVPLRTIDRRLTEIAEELYEKR